MPNIRELQQLLADFDRRQRPDARSRNRVISKYISVNDVVGLSTETLTLTASSSAYQWAVAASTSVQLYWGEGEWS